MMHIPNSTYRLQFNPRFTFQHAQQILPYLQTLGISDVYASPIFRSRKGSMHGYDVVEPNAINEELGSYEDFEKLNNRVHSLGMGWVQDVVPNHMAYHHENHYLMDVLESGVNSEFFSFFDIEWKHPLPGLRNRVLLPLLGEFYGDVLEKGQLSLQLTERGLQVAYYDLYFPIRIESYSPILERNSELLAQKLGQDNQDYIKYLGILYLVENLPSIDNKEKRSYQVRFFKNTLWELYQTNSNIKEHVDALLAEINGTVGVPESFNHLENILNEQHYRLAYWKVATEEINYRRFFTINELICVKVEDEHVFEKTHELILRFSQEKKFDGLRIDHVDGLHSPCLYLQRLRQRLPETYLTVEKVLEPEEVLPPLAVNGTTGYDFLFHSNALFVRKKYDEAFEKLYREFAKLEDTYDELLIERKRFNLQKRLTADLTRLAVTVKGIANRFRYGNDITLESLTVALREIIAHFPVYRTYIETFEISEPDKHYFTQACHLAQESNPDLVLEIQFIERFFLFQLSHLGDEDKKTTLATIQRFQQITSPAMAKSVEDNFFYIYSRLLSLNEVGCSASHFGITTRDFHQFNTQRIKHWKHAQNCVGTHDTKRGEDQRMRLNVLSEIPKEFAKMLRKWRFVNRKHKREIDEKEFPSANAEYFLYQSIIGGLPFDGYQSDDFIDRIKEYFNKSMREAGIHTSWLKPDQEVEEANANFVDQLFAHGSKNLFLKSFLPFAQKIAFYGVLNSISQKILHLTCPGVPDLYQGSELWDFSYVDPDNRRPVDYDLREQYLKQVHGDWQKDPQTLALNLLQSYSNGKIKLFIVHQLLQIRNHFKELLLNGNYRPVQVTGELAEHVIAYFRRHQSGQLLVVVPRFFTELLDKDELPMPEKLWQKTVLHLTSQCSDIWTHVLTGQTIKLGKKTKLSKLLHPFPYAVLTSKAS